MKPFVERLAAASSANRSLLCIGLDPDADRLPGLWRGDPSRLGEFCMRIVDATADLAAAYKPQIAYFSARRAEDQLERLIGHIRVAAPGVPVILDAKRGDIGATAEHYAREAFERYGADAVTLSPYMGLDSIEPYLRDPARGAFLLCRTSNAGGGELQAERLAGGEERLFERVARLAAGPWNLNGQLGLVVGATYPADIACVRSIAASLPLLLPGIGAQGGDAAATVAAAAGVDGRAPMVVNSSRAVLYASGDDDFADAARAAALATRASLSAALPGPARPASS